MNNEKKKETYYVTYSIHARYVAEVKAESINEALSLADDMFMVANFGQATDIDGTAVCVDNDDDDCVWENY